jgi:hypothetical protein
VCGLRAADGDDLFDSDGSRAGCPTNGVRQQARRGVEPGGARENAARSASAPYQRRRRTRAT